MALGKLKQTVILKWETDHMEGKPANVHLRKWLPQADLLAHPNLKAFVYSAGYYSFEESIFYGKPGVRVCPVYSVLGDNSKSTGCFYQTE